MVLRLWSCWWSSASSRHLLVALLLPALGRAREAAVRSTCANQLRQLGIGITTYANDSNSFVPVAGVLPSGTPSTSPGSGTSPPTPPPPTPRLSIPRRSGAASGCFFRTILPRTGPFFCPNTPASTLQASAVDAWWLPNVMNCPKVLAGGDPRFASIGYYYTAGWLSNPNFEGGSYDPNYQCGKLIDEPNKTLMQDVLCDEIQPSGDYVYSGNHPNSAQYAGIPDGGSFLYTDGRVVFGGSGGQSFLTGGWVGNLYIGALSWQYYVAIATH